MTAVVRFCKDCAHFAEGRCELTGRVVFPTRPACAGFAARQAPAAPLGGAGGATVVPQAAQGVAPRFARVVSLCRRRPRPGYVAVYVNVPVAVARAWAGGGREPPRKLLAIFDGKRLVLEPLEEVVEG
ncbi:MAG: hypothetical protein LM580_12375 [Thermofilum sp.]|nr:hypothetical protein [Thermofilum sp.]